MPSSIKTNTAHNRWGDMVRAQADEDARQLDYARMRELAIQGGKSTSPYEIAAIDAEFTDLVVKLFSTA